MNAAYASKSFASRSMPAASKPYIRAWLRVVPRPHSGSSTANFRSSISVANPDASSVTFSSSLVNCSFVLPWYF